jgi:SET domain-containing protein
MMTTGYLSPKLEVRAAPNQGGFAVYALKPLKKNEVLAVWGGQVVTLEQVLALPREEQGHTIQIYDELYLAPLEMAEPADYVNHSCNPNAGLCGQISLVAMRDISVGEEITFDYAMSDSSSFDEFDCTCGAPNCRGKVTGNDWQRPELWKRYEGYFSAYLQRKIEKLKGN